MLQVKIIHGAQITMPTMDGATRKFIKVVDANGKAYALLQRRDQLTAWCGNPDVESVDCVIVRHPVMRVDLTKRAAPEAVCVLRPVVVESNALVMARAIAAIRDRRLTREYIAAKDGDTGPCEMLRALNAEQSRATAARRLSGAA